MLQGLVIDMEEARLHTLAQVMASPDGAVEEAFQVPKVERHRGIERVRTRFGAACQGRADKGMLLCYLERMTRLVRPYCKDGTRSQRYRAPRQAFPRRFTATDEAVLAEMDERHGPLSVPPTKKLMERACRVFGEAHVEWLGGISVSHLHNRRGGHRLPPVSGKVSCGLIQTCLSGCLQVVENARSDLG